MSRPLNDNHRWAMFPYFRPVWMSDSHDLYVVFQPKPCGTVRKDGTRWRWGIQQVDSDGCQISGYAETKEQAQRAAVEAMWGFGAEAW